VLVVGGIGGADSSGFVIHVASAELYDPTSGTWSSTGSMLTARGSHSSNLLPNGHLLVAGGLSVNSGSFTYLASAELYDPMAGTWSTTTPFNVARSDHTATLLPNGQLLVATGLSAGTLTASAELFSLDTTAPVLSLPDTMTVNATSPLGAVVNYTASASDPDDPPEQLTVTCSPAPGTTFAIGTTTVSCAASDPFGNTSTGSFQVIVNGAAGQLTDLFSVVNSLELASGLTNSLISKLHDALSGFDAGKTARACGKLKDFISEVNAQTGKGITPAQASELITSAERIRAVMGCS
jgi:hypothetical protein